MRNLGAACVGESTQESGLREGYSSQEGIIEELSVGQMLENPRNRRF
jgi:hypothetical protein